MRTKEKKLTRRLERFWKIDTSRLATTSGQMLRRWFTKTMHKASCQWLAFLLAKKWQKIFFCHHWPLVFCMIVNQHRRANAPEGLNRPLGRWRKPVGEPRRAHRPFAKSRRRICERLYCALNRRGLKNSQKAGVHFWQAHYWKNARSENRIRTCLVILSCTYT